MEGGDKRAGRKVEMDPSLMTSDSLGFAWKHCPTISTSVSNNRSNSTNEASNVGDGEIITYFIYLVICLFPSGFLD